MAEKAEPAVASIAVDAITELLQAQDSMFDLETFTKTSNSPYPTYIELPPELKEIGYNKLFFIGSSTFHI